MTEPINLFLISTPLQLINVIEAKRELNIPDEHSVAIFITYSSNLITLKKIINGSQWKEMHFIDDDIESLRKHEKNFKNRKILPVIKKAIANLAKIKSLIRKFKEVDRLIVGYYLGMENLHMMNNIRYKSLYLLDDGIATIEVNERRKNNTSFLKNQSIEFYLKTWFKKYIFGYKLSHPTSVNFFTIYDIAVGPNDSIVKHNYTEVKKLIKGLEKTDEVFFLGQPLSEIHPEIVTEETYLHYLREIKKYFSKSNLVYIPHRDELPDKCSRIEKTLSIPIKRLDLPIELFLLNQIKKPCLLSGFITSALPNCKEIFGDELEIIAFRINPQKVISKTMLVMVENTYAYFEKISNNKFKVISID
ncbi:MAG: hypothetical protein ABIR06_19600 [Cyclobacteriaceae bacterium]